MNWKRLLTFNLTVSGKRSLFRGGFELDKDDYKPRYAYLALGKNWRGPVYFVGRNHHKDLYYVLSQIRSFVRANVPLARGMAAVAREEQRLYRGLGPAFALKQAFWQTAIFVIFAIGMAWIFGAFHITPDAAMPAALMCYLIWSTVTIFMQERKRAALFGILGVLLFMGVSAQILYPSEWLDTRSIRRVLPFHPSDLPMLLNVSIPIVFFAVAFVKAGQGGRRELLFLRLRDLLESGLDLSEAMRRLSRFFPRFHADMVEAGEQTGRMDACLTELCADVEAGMSLRKTLHGIFLYLGLVGLVQAAIAAFLMIRVVPVFYEIHAEFDSEVHTPFLKFLSGARDMMGILDFVLWKIHLWPRSNMVVIGAYVGGALLIGVAVLAVALLLLHSLRKRRRGLSARPFASLLLFIPGFRGLVMQDNFTVIACTLEKLLHAGVPLDTALAKASEGDLNPLYARMLRRVHKRILEGESFVAAFQQASDGLIAPPSFTSLSAVGEQSGMLPEALRYLHIFYRTQASIRSRILVDVVKPVGVLVIGLATLLFMSDMFGLMVGLTDALLNSM